ncbi:phosphatase PAP2 family protein [uncultured Treponema sp.]|uniref:phosphatase PAP2 family protein n=1 Tax=uncultured Treponema sp. TaxID=162155 RepID=UPI0025E96324|nr:phosphatase PAP2 family protein [uncultured Treponema sp.]
MLDIQYLLFLQRLRELSGGVFDEVFNDISKIALDVLFYLPFVIYWAIDKEWGKRFIGVMQGSELVNSLVKLTVCAYRPWIRSDLIEPAGDSKVAATGYSFPSGHTNRAAAVLGTTAVWQYKKRRWLAILSAIGILLTGFSRNFLGVHTPQDVLVGFLLSIIAIFVVGKILNCVKGKDKLADILTFAGLVFVAAAIVYIKFKPYPMDYVDGKLLADPEKLMNDAFKICGSFSALLLGLYIDRHYIHYEIPVGHKNLPVLTAVGLGIYASWKIYLSKTLLVTPLGGHLGNFIAYFIGGILAMVIIPIFITKFTKNEE